MTPKKSILLVLCALFAILQLGCATLPSKKLATAVPPGTPQCRVQLNGEGWGQPVELTLPVTEQTRVSTIVEETKAKRKFRNMNITVIRRVEENPTPLKMKISYAAGSKSVPPSQDYSIRPDVLINQVTETPLDVVVIDQIIDTPLDRIVDSVFPFRSTQR